MTTLRTHFTFRVDTWTPDGESIVEHVAGVEDYPVALATYRAACQRWPGTPITLRQGCASDRGQPVPAHGVGHRRRAVALDRLAVERVKTDAARAARHTRLPRLGGVAAVLGFHAQVTHESVKAVLVAVVLFPAGKVSDVASPRGSAAQPPWQYWNGRSRTGFSREDHVCLRQSVCRPDMATCSWRS
jgi:hypothetical protein